MQSDAPSDARPYAWENEIIGCLSIDTSASNFAGRYPTPPPSAHGAAHIDLPEFLDAALTPDSLMGGGCSASSTPSDSGFVQVESPMPDDCAGEDIILSVSTSFYPGSHSSMADLIFLSSDGVLFYLCTEIINKASSSALSGFLRGSSPGTVGCVNYIPESASILNILFHTLYDSSCAPNSPSTDDLIAAVDKMPSYGMEPRSFIFPKSPLYTLLLARAPLRPLDIYALASHHNIPELAVKTSSHLLGYQLETISDEVAIHIGPVMLKRLFLLHKMRSDALRKLILEPPGFHPQTLTCSFEDQKGLTRAWALGSSFLAWDARPDTSTHRIQSVFEPLAQKLSCAMCREALQNKIRSVLVSWAAVKCTI